MVTRTLKRVVNQRHRDKMRMVSPGASSSRANGLIAIGRFLQQPRAPWIACRYASDRPPRDWREVLTLHCSKE